MRVYSGELLPVKSWCMEPEDGAIQQARNLANLPFAVQHIAIMPDAHQGFGMCIGGILATAEVIIPNAVGVDIGCGMVATKLDLSASDMGRDRIKAIIDAIRKRIPVGMVHHKTPCDRAKMPETMPDNQLTPIAHREYQSATHQLGTLGGGNHFIEIQKDGDDHLWFMIHSGSRNIGLKVCDHYNKAAKGLNQRWFSSVPSNWDLAFLHLGEGIANSYLAEMKYCMDFARRNRNEMAAQVIGAMTEILGFDVSNKVLEAHNVHHNYADLEHHFGRDVWVHRKGAIRARDGEIGIIPGSQGSKSYIVKGKGNPESFMSCSHGAGRQMSRKKAQESLSLEKEIELMDKLGIVHGIRNKKDLDEAPSAYKEIDVVMAEQEDLVEIVTELRPMGVIKE